MKHLIKKDMNLIINYKRMIISILVFVMIFLAFSFIFKDYMKEQRLLDQVSVGIIDNEQSFLTSMLIDNFKQNEAFSGLFQISVGSESDLLKDYHQDKLSALIYLPETFTSSLLRFENTPLKMVLNPNYPLKNTVLENVMGSYSTYIKSVDVGIYSLYNTLKNEGISQEELTSINEQFSMNMVLTALGRNSLFDYQPLKTFPSASSASYFIYSIMLLIIVFTATGGSSLYNFEIQNGCLKRYVYTGQSLNLFALSKSLVLTCNISIILMPMIVIAGWMSDMNLVSLTCLFIILLLSVLTFVNLSLTLGLVFYKHRVNTLFSTMLTLVLGILGGQFIPIQVMPSFVQDLASFTPNYWILKVLLQVNQNLYNDFYPLLISLLVATFAFSGLQAILIKRTRLWEK